MAQVSSTNTISHERTFLIVTFPSFHQISDAPDPLTLLHLPELSNCSRQAVNQVMAVTSKLALPQQ